MLARRRRAAWPEVAMLAVDVGELEVGGVEYHNYTGQWGDYLLYGAALSKYLRFTDGKI